jgi:hypothetical protein
MAERLRKKLDKPTDMDFIQSQLKDVAEWLEDLHDIQFLVGDGLDAVLITFEIKGVPLAAALQAIEETTSPGIRFVVRDYGILATTRAEAEKAHMMSASEFWRQTQMRGPGQERPAVPGGRSGRDAPSRTEPQTPRR